MASKPDNSRYRREFDPYNGMEAAITRPQNIAREQLSDAEKLASKNPNQLEPGQSLSSFFDDAIRYARNNESVAHDSSKQRIKVNQQSAKGKKKNKLSFSRAYKLAQEEQGKKSVLRRYGPAGLITTLLIAVVFFLLGAQSLLGAHIVSLITRATDVQYSSYFMRTPKITSFMMDGGGQIKISNFTKKYTNFSPWLKKRLTNNGIEVGKINANGEFIPGNVVSTRNTVLRYNGEIITASDFTNKYIQDSGFRNSYYKAKRGRITGFFDDAADKFYVKHGQTRDIFDKFKSSDDPEENKTNFQDTINKYVNGTDTDINSIGERYNEETKENENFKNGDDLKTGKVSGDTPEVKAQTFVNGIASKVSTVGVPVCTGLRIANVASVTAMAYQLYKTANYFLGFSEIFSKNMAGEGDATAVNDAFNFLTSAETNEVTYIDENGNTQTKLVYGSALDSNGAKAILNNTAVNTSDVAPYSLNNIMTAAGAVAATSGASTLVCDGVQASSAILSLVSYAIPGGAIAKIAVSMVVKTVQNIALAGAVALIISAITPLIRDLFIDDNFESLTGVKAGEAFFSGAAQSNYSLATQGSAAMPSSASRLARANYSTSVAIAQESAMKRVDANPFDITNQDTFMGTLLRKFNTLAYTGSFSNMFSSVSSLTTSSLKTIIPGAYADSGDVTYSSITQECENLKGAVCDMYGHPIPAIDYSTIDIEPDDPTYESVISANLDDKGKIKDNSELAKFITYCADRESPWGVTDANILNSLQSGNLIAQSLPLVGDILDVVNAAEDVAYQGWATGEICMNSESNPRWEGEFKYYQRYIEDMRILDTFTGEEDEEESNPVALYRKEYELNNPIDTSLEGTLARISGQTKEDIALLIDYVEYQNWIATYKPEERYAFGAEVEKEPELKLDNSNFIDIFNQIAIIQEPTIETNRRAVETC